MGVSQMLGLQTVSITSPSNANCSVVYLGVLPQIVQRSIHRKQIFQLKNCMHGCSKVYEQADRNGDLLRSGKGVVFSTTTISAHSFPSMTYNARSNYRNCAQRKAQQSNNSAPYYDYQSNEKITLRRISNLY